MNRLVINLEGLRHNLQTVDKWVSNHGGTWTLVTKVLCGHEQMLGVLADLGVGSVGDSRLANLDAITAKMPAAAKWYLRIPELSKAQAVVGCSEVSLNSEIEVIRELNASAFKLGRVHRIIIMIELGDLREGILPGSLVNFYKKVFELPNIEVMGIGGNLGCLSGAVPTVDHFMQLILYRELLELKFHQPLPVISAGSTATLPLMLDGQMPAAINHSRIGEAVFLGTDLIHGGVLKDLRDDVFVLEAEIAEIKKKSLVSTAETANITPFASEFDPAECIPGQRGYRALVSIGNLDTDISGITPVDARYRMAGASSDISVVNLGENDDSRKVGDKMAFRVNYSALLRLMESRYVIKDIQNDSAKRRDALAPLKKPSFFNVKRTAETVLAGTATR